MTPLGHLASLGFFVPEIALALGALLVLQWDLFAPVRARCAGTVTIALASLGVSLVASVVALSSHARFAVPALLFGGQLACDGFACTFRAFFAVVTAIVIVAQLPSSMMRRQAGTGELLALLLAACLGLNLMAMARSLLMVYLAVEIVSLASFVLAAYRFADRRGSEGAVKLAMLGGLSTGVMLYGMSWVYGLTRSIVFPEIAERVLALTREQSHLPNALAIGAACVVAGLAYKIGVAPFHMGEPDVYEGAPTLIAAFFSVGPKAAGLAVLVRFFRDALGATGIPLEAQAPWPVLAGMLAVTTMTLGNLGALTQTNLKRLLAYSSVAQAGTMLLAFSALDDEGVTAIGFYLVVYCAMNLGAFVVVHAVTQRLGDDSIGAMRGLGVRAPGMAALMTVFLLSLVGLPPFAGFVGKLYVLAALLRAPGDYRTWYAMLACAAVANTALSFFYCARVVREMYLEPLPEGAGRVSVPRLYTVVATALALPVLTLGVWWGPAYELIARSMARIP